MLNGQKIKHLEKIRKQSAALRLAGEALEEISQECDREGIEEDCDEAGCSGIHGCPPFIAKQAIAEIKAQSGEVNGKDGG